MRKRLTSLSTGADNEKWSPRRPVDRVHVERLSRLRGGRLQPSRDDASEKSKVKARVYDHLPIATGTHWTMANAATFFVRANGGAPRDVTAER